MFAGLRSTALLSVLIAPGFLPAVAAPGADFIPLTPAQSAALGVPRVAIGGLTPDNSRPVVEAGADLIAVISGVFSEADPVAALEAYRGCFQHK